MVFAGVPARCELWQSSLAGCMMLVIWSVASFSTTPAGAVQQHSSSTQSALPAFIRTWITYWPKFAACRRWNVRWSNKPHPTHPFSGVSPAAHDKVHDICSCSRDRLHVIHQCKRDNSEETQCKRRNQYGYWWKPGRLAAAGTTASGGRVKCGGIQGWQLSGPAGEPSRGARSGALPCAESAGAHHRRERGDRWVPLLGRLCCYVFFNVSVLWSSRNRWV